MTTRRPLRADTRIEALCNSLRTLAFAKGPGAQLPTVSTLCRELAVSSVTLKEALDLLETEEIIYRKRSLGIFVSPSIHRKSIHILFASAHLISETLSPFWALLWLRLEQEARRRETFKNEKFTFHLVTPLASTEDSLPEEIKTIIYTQRVHGLLAIGLHTKGAGTEADPPIPCVTFAGGGANLVIIDTNHEGRLAAEELIRQGCKKMACWMPNMGYFLLPHLKSRDIPHLTLEEMSGFTSFRQTILDHKFPFYSEFARQPYLPLTQQSLSAQEQGYLLAKEVFGNSHPHKPDGLFIGDDLLADGALTAIEELNIQIGSDLKIVSHANTGSPILFAHRRKITTLEFNSADIAQAMFSQLDSLMAGHTSTAPLVVIRPNLH